MKIGILVEGATEVAFKGKLRQFFHSHLDGQMPRLQFYPQSGRIPKEQKLKRLVENLLSGRNACDVVIALTDVYTGTDDFANAEEAKTKMNQWVGHNPNFYPHVALHDFEAWLLPYWLTIQKLAQHSRSAPSGTPETVNHGKPPAYHLKEIFRIGKCKRDYSKIIHSQKILKNNDLRVAIQACPELKAFVNRIIELCDASKVIP